MLFLAVWSILLAAQQSWAQIVTCYSSFDKRTGECSGLLGDGVDQDDCCLNQAYGFINDSGACQSCGPATWSEWSSWGACTVTCLEGVKQRRRRCDGVGECPGNSAVLETKSCSDQDCCPGSGGWTDWGSWQPCSVTCKSGTKVRRRSCTAPPPSCGGSCYGTDTETASCDTFQECPIHGGWSAWGAWGKCSGSCIWEQPRFVPTRTRIRTCTNPAPSLSPPGRPCGGQTEEQEDCSSLPFCPVDGGWSQWSPSGSCSVTCGLGLRQMTRQCNSPAPKHNGRPCVGSTTSNALCNTATHCPADGQWSEWTEWTLCSRAGRKIDCKRTGGTQRRTRVCKGQAFGGNPCPEDYSESRACYYLKDCIMKGKEWSEWSDWGLCEPSCGPDSQKARSRNCKPDLTEYSTEVGIHDAEAFFWGTPRVNCPELEGQRRKLEQKEPCLNVPECT